MSENDNDQIEPIGRGNEIPPENIDDIDSVELTVDATIEQQFGEAFQEWLDGQA